jgi:methionine synthase II (cobalamin-independent)
MVDLAEHVLRPAIDQAVAAGSELIHLQEPWLAYHGIESRDWSPFGEALAILHRDLRATLALHLYFGDAAPHVARLRKLPIDAIGIDFIETDTAGLGGGWEVGLVAGVINGRDSIVESTDNLVQVARHLADAVKPPALYLTSSCELAYLPTVVAKRKVQRLGEAGRTLKELVSV